MGKEILEKMPTVEEFNSSLNKRKNKAMDKI